MCVLLSFVVSIVQNPNDILQMYHSFFSLFFWGCGGWWEDCSSQLLSPSSVFLAKIIQEEAVDSLIVNILTTCVSKAPLASCSAAACGNVSHARLLI